MRIKLAIAFTAIFVFLFVFNYLTPLSFGDDYVYSFVWTGKSMYEPLPDNIKRLTNWGDLFYSQWSHYLTWSGRFIAHFLTQFFLWKGKTLFNIANTFVSVFLICEIYWCICKGKVNLQFENRTIFWIFFLLWACTPGFGVVFFWLTGACNYLWANVFLLGFFVIYVQKFYSENQLIFTSKTMVLIMFLFGIIAGWTNENSVCWIILLLALFNYKCKKNNTLQKWMISGWVGLLTGYCLLMLAPGNFIRLTSENKEWNILSGVSQNFSTMILIFLFQFFLWYFLIRSLYIISYSNIHNSLLDKDVFLVKVLSLTAFCMTAIMLFSPGFPARSGFPGLLYLIIADGILLRIQKEYHLILIQENAQQLLVCVSIIFFLINTGFVFRNYYSYYLQRKSLMVVCEQMDNNKKKYILTVEQFNSPSEHEDLYTTLHLLRHELSENECEWKNVAFARYYNIRGIRMKKREESIDKPKKDNIQYGY